MGKTELAANWFRITQTEERIKNTGLRGQLECERAAHTVGQKVRRAMLERGGTAPEVLPPARDIKRVCTQIKSTQREFKKVDEAASAQRRPQTTPAGEPRRDRRRHEASCLERPRGLQACRAIMIQILQRPNGAFPRSAAKWHDGVANDVAVACSATATVDVQVIECSG